jgi:hypothetical protein
MSEYKIAKTWAIFIYIFTPILLGLSVWMLTLPFVKGGPIDWTTFWILAPIAIGLIALMVFGLIETIKGKFVIDENKIVSISSFSYRELLLNEIKGYRIGEKYIIIESNNEEKKNIKVSTYFGKMAKK